MSETREAGRELDAEIATRVMGWRLTCPVEEGCGHSVGTKRDGSSAKRNFVNDGERERVLPEFSADIAVAWLVVEKMREKGLSCVVATNACAPQQNGCKFYAGWRGLGHSLFDADAHEGWDAVADTIPTAICNAALRAVAALPVSGEPDA